MPKGKREISVSTLRDELPELLSRVSLLGESYTIVKHGKTIAVIKPYDEGGEEEHTSDSANTLRRAKASGAS